MVKTSEERKIKYEVDKIFKRMFKKLGKDLERHFHKIFKNKKNVNGLTNRNTRDCFLSDIVSYYETTHWKIFTNVFEKFDFNYKKINVIIYKENENFTDIFFVFDIKISNKLTVKTGIAITIMVKDIFATLMNKKDINEITKDKKRPKRFHHYKTFKII